MDAVTLHLITVHPRSVGSLFRSEGLDAHIDGISTVAVCHRFAVRGSTHGVCELGGTCQ